jgi:glucan phosphoethanolaminetransferase (alkaline phosphatase superfamily)
MGIVWLIIPIMEIGYWLIAPFIIGLIISMKVITSPRALLVSKLFLLLIFVVIFAIVQVNHPKDWPSLFFYCQLVSTVVVYLFYLKLVSNLAANNSSKEEQKHSSLED